MGYAGKVEEKDQRRLQGVGGKDRALEDLGQRILPYQDRVV